MAHTLGNPLAGLCLTLDLMEPSAATERRYLARAQHLGARICAIKDLLSALGGAVRSAPGWVEVAPLFAALVAEVAPGPPYVLQAEVAAGSERVWGHAGLLRYALEALVRNAIDAAPDGCTVILRAQAQASGTRLEVEDDGPGVPPALRAQLFSAPCSSRPHGAGVGLVLVGMIVEQVHAGAASLLAATRGAHFALDLPAPAAA